MDFEPFSSILIHSDPFNPFKTLLFRSSRSVSADFCQDDVVSEEEVMEYFTTDEYKPEVSDPSHGTAGDVNSALILSLC